MGNTGRLRGVEGDWDEYISHIYWSHAGEGGAVGGSTSNIRILCTGEGVIGRGLAEGTVVEKRGSILGYN